MAQGPAPALTQKGAFLVSGAETLLLCSKKPVIIASRMQAGLPLLRNSAAAKSELDIHQEQPICPSHDLEFVMKRLLNPPSGAWDSRQHHALAGWLMDLDGESGALRGSGHMCTPFAGTEKTPPEATQLQGSTQPLLGQVRTALSLRGQGHSDWPGSRNRAKGNSSVLTTSPGVVRACSHSIGLHCQIASAAASEGPELSAPTFTAEVASEW